MNLSKVRIEITVDSLTALIAGLYISTHQTRIEAIPQSLFLEIAEKLYPYLPVWDYNRCTFEDWIRTFLLIAPKIVIDENELSYMKANNEIYLERHLGNVVLIASAPVVVQEVVNHAQG